MVRIWAIYKNFTGKTGQKLCDEAKSLILQILLIGGEKTHFLEMTRGQ